MHTTCDAEIQLKTHSVYWRPARDAWTDELRKDRFEWDGLVQVRWRDKRLSFVVTCESKVQPKDEDTALVSRVLNQLASERAKVESLSAFDKNHLSYDLAGYEPGEELITVGVPQSFISTLDSEFETDQKVRQNFALAKQDLTDFAECPSSSLGDPAYRYLMGCIEAGISKSRLGWNKGNLSSVGRCIADLNRRSRPSHPGYRQSQSTIQRYLYYFYEPDAWIEMPPTTYTTR